MSNMDLKRILKDFNEAVNETALAKSKFYDQVVSEIKATVSRKRIRLDHEGKPIFYEIEIELENLEGKKIEDSGKPIKKKINIPFYEKVSIDDMISGIFSLGSRGNKLQTVPDSFIKRVGRGAKYSRILEKTETYDNITDLLQELVREDIERIIKIILPDLTKVTMPAHQKLAAGAGDKPRLSDVDSPGFLT